MTWISNEKTRGGLEMYLGNKWQDFHKQINRKQEF